MRIDHPLSDAWNCLAGGLRLRQCDMQASDVCNKTNFGTVTEFRIDLHK